MTWPRLIVFAVISGVVTGLIALLVPEGNSFRQVAVTLEAWIVLAILVVVNCDAPLEAACKTFVYFLISQPLVYLVQAPFHSMGLGLFRYYYPTWFYWTLATFPGAFIAWYIKRDNILSAVILSVALGALTLFGAGYLRSTINAFPQYLIATLFCYGMVPMLILAILKTPRVRWIAAALAVLMAVAGAVYEFGGGVYYRYQVSFGLDPAKYPVTAEWTAQMEDPANGTVTLQVFDSDIILPVLHVEILNLDGAKDIILTDPAGNQYRIPAEMEESGGSKIVIYNT